MIDFNGLKNLTKEEGISFLENQLEEIKESHNRIVEFITIKMFEDNNDAIKKDLNTLSFVFKYVTEEAKFGLDSLKNMSEEMFNTIFSNIDESMGDKFYEDFINEFEVELKEILNRDDEDDKLEN